MDLPQDLFPGFEQKVQLLLAQHFDFPHQVLLLASYDRYFRRQRLAQLLVLLDMVQPNNRN